MPKQSKGKLPAFQFYTGDWLKDPNLSLCSPATRGIFMDLLSAMHENDRSGRIVGTPHQLSRLARCTVEEMEAALLELHETATAEVSDVTFCNGPVTVTNRRMRREWRERKSNAERVKRHRERDRNGEGDGGVTEKSRLPSSSSSSTSVTETTSPARFAPPDARAALFSDGLRVVTTMTGKPEARCRTLLGKWLKAAGDDAAHLLVLLRQASADRRADLVSWIEACLRADEAEEAAYRGAL